MTCTVEGCVTAARRRGWCERHYARWRRHGNPVTLIKTRGSCSVDDCDRDTEARGLCEMHWWRWRRTGDPSKVRTNKVSFDVRLWPRLTPEGDCWIWTGYADKRGYGRIHVDGSPRMVHRVAYELMVCEIPTGLTLDHLCRRILCCNPYHLEPVTRAVNTQREMAARALERAA